MTKAPEPDQPLPPGWVRLSIRCERSDGQFVVNATVIPEWGADPMAAHKAGIGVQDALHRLRELPR